MNTNARDHHTVTIHSKGIDILFSYRHSWEYFTNRHEAIAALSEAIVKTGIQRIEGKEVDGFTSFLEAVDRKTQEAVSSRPVLAIADAFIVGQSPNGPYIDIDENSGYPYAIHDVLRARSFSNFEVALKIAKFDTTMPLKVYRIASLTLEDCSSEVDKRAEYDTKLAALKAEYGVD